MHPDYNVEKNGLKQIEKPQTLQDINLNFVPM